MYIQQNDKRQINHVESHIAAIFNMLYLIIWLVELILSENLSITIGYNFT